MTKTCMSDAFYLIKIFDACAVFFREKYSGISIKRTHHKADTSLKRTIVEGTDRFASQTLIKQSL